MSLADNELCLKFISSIKIILIVINISTKLTSHIAFCDKQTSIVLVAFWKILRREVEWRMQTTEAVSIELITVWFNVRYSDGYSVNIYSGNIFVS